MDKGRKREDSRAELTPDTERQLAERRALVEQALDKMEKYLLRTRRRRTPERFAITRRVFEMDSHFLIDELAEAMEESGYHVSRATVYSTVAILCECGILRRHLLDGSHSRYEVAGGSHCHLVCTDCGRLREIEIPELSETLARIRIPYFSGSYISTTIFGVCSACRRKRKQKEKKLNER